MVIKHGGATPRIHPSSYVAPAACLCGDVEIGAHCRIMHGATLIAEGGRIRVGEQTVVLENAVLRSTARFDLNIAGRTLIGPHAHLAGCEIQKGVFVATGASIFHGAVLEEGAEVRIRGVVHLRTRLPKNTTVPIGWVAVGEPVRILPPQEHDSIWGVQRELDFPGSVYGIDRDSSPDVVGDIVEYMIRCLSGHFKDEVIGEKDQ
jgi:carbonic anhydrase/acetyltransferase-like protein (isoleucine patch superfamily)